MKTTKAVITAAARSQRTLPLQTLVDRDGVTKSVLGIVIEEAIRAGIEEIGVVLCPGDEAAYKGAAGGHAARVEFIPQPSPNGYGHAIWCAREFVDDQPFLHMVGDHVYVSRTDHGCAEGIVAVAQSQACSVSGVQSTREHLLPLFGAVGGQRLKSTQDLYVIDRVIEKPTPTEAEQSLMVPGLRAGHYLCFFGIHAFTPLLMEILNERVAAAQEGESVGLSPALAELANRERYLALESQGKRYPVDVKYGLLTAQLALALGGREREEVLSALCELLAQRDLSGITPISTRG